MTPEAPTIAALTTYAGIAAFVLVTNQLIWQVSGASDAIKARFGPLVAGVTGLVGSVAAAAFLQYASGDVAQAGLTGFFGGLGAAGAYDLIKSKAGLSG